MPGVTPICRGPRRGSKPGPPGVPPHGPPSNSTRSSPPQRSQPRAQWPAVTRGHHIRQADTLPPNKGFFKYERTPVTARGPSGRATAGGGGGSSVGPQPPGLTLQPSQLLVCVSMGAELSQWGAGGWPAAWGVGRGHPGQLCPGHTPRYPPAPCSQQCRGDSVLKARAGLSFTPWHHGNTDVSGPREEIVGHAPTSVPTSVPTTTSSAPPRDTAQKGHPKG